VLSSRNSLSNRKVAVQVHQVTSNQAKSIKEIEEKEKLRIENNGYRFKV
jgi:hypothetical protein